MFGQYLQDNVFLVVDGNSLIMASYYIAQKSGIRLPYQIQNAKHRFAYMFANSLEKIIQSVNPTYLCVCFDDGSKTFRHELFPEYKTHRSSLPQELIDELINIPIILEKYGIVTLSNKKLERKFSVRSNGVKWDHVEADDIVASVVKTFSNEKCKFVIYTNDYDISQIIDASTSLLVKNRRKKSAPLLFIDSKEFFKIFQIYPEQFVDFLAIKGDNSDNIPGVPGFGMKRTAKMLAEYKSIEGIFDNLESLPTLIQEALTEHREIIIRNRSLVTLKTFSGLDNNIEDFGITSRNLTQLKSQLL